MACKNKLDPGTGLVDPSIAARCHRRLHLPPPAARATRRHGRPWATSTALIGGWSPWNRPTPRQFCQVSVGPVLSDRTWRGPPPNRPLEGRGPLCVPGTPHGWGGPSPGTCGAHAPKGRPGWRSAHTTLALFCPGRALRPQPKVVQVLRGATLWGTTCNHQDYGGFDVSTISWYDHRLQLEGVPLSGYQTTTCKRESNKGEGRSLSCEGITFLPINAAALLLNMEESVGAFSDNCSLCWKAKNLPMRSPSTGFSSLSLMIAKVSMWCQSLYTFSFTLPVEGEPLFLQALERLQNLYPWAYARGTISTSEGAENWDLIFKLSVCTHPVDAGLDSPLGGGDPPPPPPDCHR